MSTTKFELNAAGVTTTLRATLTDVPGLVAFRTASGWYVGHLPSGTRVSAWPMKTKDRAVELAKALGPLTDWSRADLDLWRTGHGDPSLYLKVTEAQVDFEGGIKPFTKCDNRYDCLRNQGHPGAHEARGKKWRDG